MGKPVKIVPLCANVSCQIEILLERFPDGLRGPVFAALLDETVLQTHPTEATKRKQKKVVRSNDT
jgi:hypothetical protein